MPEPDWLRRRFPQATFEAMPSRHQLYRVHLPGGRTLGVKLPTGPADVPSVAHEAAVRRALHGQGFAAAGMLPQPVPAGGAAAVGWVWVSGEPARGWARRPEAARRIGRTLARAHAALAAAFAAGAPLPRKSPGAWKVPELLAAGAGGAPWSRALLDGLRPVWDLLPRMRADWAAAGRPCHGDFHAENLLLPDGPAADAVVLDWEFASLGDPAVDAGMLAGEALAEACAGDPDDLEETLAGVRELLAAYAASSLVADPGFEARTQRHAALALAQRAYRGALAGRLDTAEALVACANAVALSPAGFTLVIAGPPLAA